jgi:flavin-dependent dehydrogenase
MVDAVVIGARCAGASTALLLARGGLDVLLVDRGRFPSEIPHGHYIHRHGPRRLRDWGLLDRVLASGCPPAVSITTDFGDFPLVGRDLVVDGVPIGLGPRRSALDAVLVEAAVEAGAELREGFPVEELVYDDGRVAGVRSGETTERARLVIGADGKASRVARWVEAPAYEEAPTLTCWYFSYWSGIRGDGLELYHRDRRVIFAFPTNDGLFAIFVAWPIDELETVRADIESELLVVVDGVPEFAERVRAGRREERFYGATALPNFLRRPYGPGWALVGDAGCHKDPYRALGVCDAFRDAELLADAVADVFESGTAEAEAFAGYERRRNEATLSEYRENLRLARLGPFPADVLELRAAIRGDDERTRSFYVASEGLASVA